MNDFLAAPFVGDDDPMRDTSPLATVRDGPVLMYPNLTQGCDEWLQLRCGMLTASEVKLILTPTLKVANNDKTRQHCYEIAAQRITGYVEPHYVSDDMLRGQIDEVDARLKYEDKIAPVTTCGFIVNDSLGFPVGFSPDGLVGDDGLIEIKSRRQKYQVQTIVDNVLRDKATTIPIDYLLQCQTGLWVSGRKWLDFISYSGGLPMAVVRVWPDPTVQAAITEAAEEFEDRVKSTCADFKSAMAGEFHLFPTERKEYEDLIA